MSRRVCHVAAAMALAASGAALAGVFTPEGEGCPESSVVVQLGKVEYADGNLRVSGHFTTAGPAAGVLLEYTAVGDRYRAETRMVTDGDLENTFPFKLCGNQTFRLWAYPVVASANRQLICLRRGGTAKQDFNAACGAALRVSDSQWSCDSGGSCTGTFTANVGDGTGVYDLMMSVARAQFQPAGKSGAGPFHLTVTCKSGDEVKLRARSSATAGYSGSVELVCGQS